METFYDAPNDYRNYLAHHGVKGMKWGVRHDPIRKGRRRKKGILDKIIGETPQQRIDSLKPRQQVIEKKNRKS